MQEVFEKILRRIDDEQNGMIKSNEVFTMGEYEGLTDAKKIIKQEAAEYYKENCFNLDHATLHKCPKCGLDAEHRINRKGSWACGCFRCNLFKTLYDHAKAIQAWENFCSGNKDWIPCSERLPEKKGKYLTTSKIYFVPDHVDEPDNYIGLEITYYSEINGWNGEVIAWQPLPAPYQPKGE